jgi:hypothetical protein
MNVTFLRYQYLVQCLSLGNDIVPNMTGSLLALDLVYRYTSVDLDNGQLVLAWCLAIDWTFSLTLSETVFFNSTVTSHCNYI